MKKLLLTCWFVSLMSNPLLAQQAEVTPLFSKDLVDMPGKEGLMITVNFPPGSTDSVHRHNRMCSSMCWKAPLSCRSREGNP